MVRYVNKKPHDLRIVTAFIGIGSNLGNMEENIRKGLKMLGGCSGVRIVRVSSLYISTPIECEGGDFLNGVCEVETELEPRELLEHILLIEKRCGRERSAGKKTKEARVLDFDILFYGNEVINHKDLIIPLKGIELRGFVLAPLNEIAPNAIHPVSGKTVAELFETWQDTHVFHEAIKGIRKFEF